MGTPVVAHLVPGLGPEHLVGVTDTRIGHDELLHYDPVYEVVEQTIQPGVFICDRVSVHHIVVCR